MKMLSHQFIQCILVAGAGILLISNAIAQSLDTDKQIALRLQILTTGEKILHWNGQENYTYFIQVTPDLSDWTWAPNIEPGIAAPMSYEVDGPTAKGFFRLIRSDQTAANLDTADFDGDALSNLYEITPRPRPGGINGHAGLNPNIQTNPLLADTDGDGLNDKWEQDHGLDPTDNGSRDLNNSPDGDPDGDGLTTAQELLLGTNIQNPDTDGDGVPDGVEVEAGTDPKNPADFPVQVVSISKRSYGYSRKNPAEPLPYGVFRWGANWFADNHEDLSSNLDASPSNLLSKITDIIFPALPPAQILPGHGDGQGSLGGNSGIENSIFYWKTKSTPTWYPNSPISTGLLGDINIQRIWLKAPISTHEQKFDFLRQKAKSTFDDDLWVRTKEIISTEAVTMVIPAGQTYSAPLDLQPIPAIVEGYSMTSNASDSLLRAVVQQENYSSAQGIRFCRWLDAFHDGLFDSEFADKDRDRFRITFPTIIPNLTKIKIKSTNIQGAVIGGAWLGKTSDGDYEVKMKQENSGMVSNWILLVSDGDDDVNYNGKGTDDGKDDQTLLADFGSKIIVTLPEFSNAKFEFSAQKPVGVVKINTVYLSPAGDLPFDEMEAISLHVGKMKEIYRQIGVRVEASSTQGKAAPQAWFDPVSATGEVANHLNASECHAARNKIRSLQVSEKTIRIGYVNATMAPDVLFPSRTAFGFTDLGTDGIVVSLDIQQARRVLGVTAHEAGHALDLDHVGSEHLLMKSPLFWDNGKRDSKRFEEGDFNKIKAKNAFYVPLQ